ncbi:ADP-ribosylglycohydrolase, partial [Pseudomonas coronafaciens pv. atropurpurea]
AILGAMLGACTGMQAWPRALIEQIDAVNALELAPLVDQLLALRAG